MSRWDVVSFVKNKIVNAIDFSSNFGTIEIEHREIHNGNGFNTNKALIENDTLATNEKLYVYACVDEFPIHLKTTRVQFDKSKVRIKIYEDVEFDCETGEEITAYAMNRVNVRDPAVKIYESDVVPDLSNATLIGENRLQGLEEGSGNKLVGSPAADQNNLEYIYKPNTTYVIELENIDATTIEFLNIYWFWYVAKR